MKAFHFEISGVVARDKDIPATFIAAKLIEREKAVYVYGHGAMSPNGCCARCGRTLTHPGSILIGIGPECLGDWGARDVRLDNLSEDEISYLKSLSATHRVDTWLPKSIIKEIQDTEEEIDVPADHPMLNGKKEPISPTARQAAMITYQDTGKKGIKVVFPYAPDDVTHVKLLPGRRFHDEGAVKYWTVPLSVESVEALIFWGFSLDEKLKSYLTEKKISVDDVKELDVPELRKELMSFQKKGVAFIEAKKGRALLGDEMGLGKTIQALAYLQLHPELRPAVIVVPASLKLNWRNEILSTMTEEHHNIQILSGTKANMPIVGDIIIINYDILSAWVGRLQNIDPKILIADECHFFKSNKAQRTKAIKALGKRVPKVLALSGTPIVNRPQEIFNALSLVDDSVFPSFWKFAHRYCGAKHNGFGWDFTGASNTEELHQKLTATIMLRRVKKDVLTELPDKQWSHIPLELNNRKRYNEARNDFIAFLRKEKGEEEAQKATNAEVLVEITGLQMLAAEGKLDAAIEWIRDFLETDEKLVVFATHTLVINRLMQEFGERAVKVDGSVTGEQRTANVERFQTDESCRLFVGNVKAAGVGITLTAASNVVFLELPWTPGDLSQATDRCHRIGQKNAVNVYYLIAEDTIDEMMAELLDRKRKVLDQVLDGKVTEEASMLSELIKAYREG